MGCRCRSGYNSIRNLVRLFLVVFAVALWISPATAVAQSEEQFYRGKSLRIVVGYPPGGGFDVPARILARHIRKYIAGYPSVIVQNMPGAGSLIAINYVFNVAPRDGTVIGTFGSPQMWSPILGIPDARFDARQFNWVGALDKEGFACFVRADSPWNNIHEATTSSEAIFMGASGPGSVTYSSALVINEVLGTKFKIISGYGGGPPIFVAMEGRELHGTCIPWAVVMTARPDWLNKGFIKVLVQAGRKHDDLPKVPMAEDMSRSENDKRLLRAYLAPFEMYRPYAFPPDVPEARVELLRHAFAAAAKDSTFVAEMGKAGFDVNPSTGEEIQKLVQEIFSAPPPGLVGKLKKIYGQ